MNHRLVTQHNNCCASSYKYSNSIVSIYTYVESLVPIKHYAVCCYDSRIVYLNFMLPNMVVSMFINAFNFIFCFLLFYFWSSYTSVRRTKCRLIDLPILFHFFLLLFLLIKRLTDISDRNIVLITIIASISIVSKHTFSFIRHNYLAILLKIIFRLFYNICISHTAIGWMIFFSLFYGSFIKIAIIINIITYVKRYIMVTER